MPLLRWIFLLPGAIVAGIAGSLAGGIAASFFGQAAADTGSAFAGPFAFVFAACVISPSHRRAVGIFSVALVAVLASGTFVLSTFTTIEEFSRLAPRERVVTPVAQSLGALYALFISLPIVTPGATVERLWREIVALGTVVVVLGGALMVVGAGVALFGRGWLGFAVGFAVAFLGAMTWAFPFVQMTRRANKARAVMEEHLREMAAREKT